MSDRFVNRACQTLRLAPIFIVGCNSILGIDSGHPKDKDAGDDVATMDTGAGPESDVGVEANPPIADAQIDRSTGDGSIECTARWPARPSRDDDPMGAGPDIVLAVETMQVEDKAGKNLGLDLDGRCSCPDVSACLLAGKPLDKTCQLAPGGRDIVGNFLLKQVAAQESAFSETSLQARLDAGSATILLRITNYNGQANDQTVTLELFGKAWMPQPDGGLQPIPQRDGSDSWTIYPDTVAFGDQAVQRDGLAYVNDHTLVAHLTDATVALRPHIGESDNPLIIEVHDAVMAGKLVATDRGFRLESATIAGRWPSDRILKSFGAIRDTGGSICGTNLSFLLLKTGVCASLDIATKQADDTGQSACSAVSFGLGFSAGPAHIAPDHIAPVFEADSCGDDWAPTCN